MLLLFNQQTLFFKCLKFSELLNHLIWCSYLFRYSLRTIVCVCCGLRTTRMMTCTKNMPGKTGQFALLLTIRIVLRTSSSLMLFNFCFCRFQTSSSIRINMPKFQCLFMSINIYTRMFLNLFWITSMFLLLGRFFSTNTIQYGNCLVQLHTCIFRSLL